MNHNQRFAELAGISLEHKWVISGKTARCDCGIVVDSDLILTVDPHQIPDYAAELWRVLKVMMEREDWTDFADAHFLIATIDMDGTTTYGIPTEWIIDRTGKLRNLATEWMEGRKG